MTHVSNSSHSNNKNTSDSDSHRMAYLFGASHVQVFVVSALEVLVVELRLDEVVEVVRRVLGGM